MTGIDAVAVLASWEAGADAPVAVRGPAALAALHPGVAVLDLPLAEVAALALAHLADEVEGVLECSGCGELLDVRVRLSDLHQAGSAAPADRSLRAPTPRDMAAAAASPDPRAVLLRRCAGVDPDELSAAELASIDDDLEALAGPALPVLRAECPECGGAAAGAVDAVGLLWQQLSAEAGGVLRDVAELASAFGWREADVLALSPSRRAAYLALAGR